MRTQKLLNNNNNKNIKTLSDRHHQLVHLIFSTDDDDRMTPKGFDFPIILKYNFKHGAFVSLLNFWVKQTFILFKSIKLRD